MVTTLDIAEKTYTVAEWLELEKRSEIRHEFYYGKLIPMPGEARQANTIAKNIVKLIDDELYEKGFEVYNHDVKTEVIEDAIYRYPDIVVTPKVDDEDAYVVKKPVLLVEIASGNSKHRDRVRKRKEYFEVPTLWYYLVVSQDEMYVILHKKVESGNWETLYFTEPIDTVDLEKFGLKLPLSEIYKRVKITTD